MNSNEVERRLEALAAGSANPEVPAALFKRLAQLESGSATSEPLLPTSQVLPFRRGRGSRARGITVLGLAATLVLAGGVIYVAGNRGLNTTTRPSPQTTGPAPTSASVAPTSNPSLPVSLGPWSQIQELDSMIGGYRPGSVSWQDGHFVGGATGVDDTGRRGACALHSTDGRNWTCTPLRPHGVQCKVDGCVDLNAIAVNNGHFVAVTTANRLFAASDNMLSGAFTTFVWTSTDGIHWQEQAKAPFPGDFVTTHLLPIASGFVLTGSRTDSGPVIWTSSDGASWQPAAFTSGVGTMTRAWTVGDPAFGYMAQGECIVGGAHRICSAHSSDGRTWTIGYPLAAAPAALAPRLFLNVSGGNGIAYTGGRWTIDFSTMFNDKELLPDSGWYTASSTDGVAWTVARAPDPTLIVASGLPSYGLPNGTSMWTMDDPLRPATLFSRQSGHTNYAQIPGWTPGIYWSTSGLYWVRVGASPAGVPIAVAESPTEVIAIMAGYANEDRSDVHTLTVWAAPKQ